MTRIPPRPGVLMAGMTALRSRTAAARLRTAAIRSTPAETRVLASGSSRRRASDPARHNRSSKAPPEGADHTLEGLETIVARFAGVPVVLLGDLVLDEFAYGEIARVSREAPVLILDYKRSKYVPGGGANAAANLAALGASVRVVGRVGRDEAGARILELLEERRIARTGILRDPTYDTPVKTRILAGGAHTSKQQIVRVDRGRTRQPLGRRAGDVLLQRLRRASRGAAALLVADYDFGAASPALLERARSLPPLVTLDSRFRVLEFRGVTAATPNVAEVEQALGQPLEDDDPGSLASAGASMRRTLRAQAVVITQGSRGMTLFERGRAPRSFPPFGGDEVADVTGAGDTVISAFTLAIAAGGSFSQATCLANVAGGLVVMKRGTATVSAVEIRKALRGAPATRRA